MLGYNTTDGPSFGSSPHRTSTARISPVMAKAARMHTIQTGKNVPTNSMDGALEHPAEPLSARQGNQIFLNSRINTLFS